MRSVKQFYFNLLRAGGSNMDVVGRFDEGDAVNPDAMHLSKASLRSKNTAVIYSSF